MSVAVEARKFAGALVVDTFFRSLTRVARLHPQANPAKHDVEVTKNVAYLASGREHHLADIYRPAKHAGPLPIVLYVHGGGFRILSKDSHWIMGLLFARRGFLVVSINYRLAPKHPYPAALEDCAAAYEWVVRNGAALGGDTSRLFLAGESAGANLVTAMSVAACMERPEPFAKKIFETGVVPVATLPACGMLQVTDSERFGRRKKLPAWLSDRMIEVETTYLPRAAPEHGFGFADPLVLLEEARATARPLPAFFVACGTKDPLLDDSRRLAKALDALGATHELKIYPGGVHAFHAMVFQKIARDHWRDNFRFMDRVLGR
ncbi:MAG: alpha/beta hydrolase [Polyangiaceae bacterium]